jgi:hypothetical protein
MIPQKEYKIGDYVYFSNAIFTAGIIKVKILDKQEFGFFYRCEFPSGCKKLVGINEIFNSVDDSIKYQTERIEKRKKSLERKIKAVNSQLERLKNKIVKIVGE